MDGVAQAGPSCKEIRNMPLPETLRNMDPGCLSLRNEVS